MNEVDKIVGKAECTNGYNKAVFSMEDVVGNFSSRFLNEAECAEFILRRVHGDSVMCPECGCTASDKQAQVFWTGKPVVCLECGKRYQGSTGTFFKGSFGSYAQFYLILLLLGYGLGVCEVARISGKDRKTVSKWKQYFENVGRFEMVI